MIFPGSRYENADVDFIQITATEFGQSVIPANVNPLGVLFQRYVTREGDRYDTLAAKLWADPMKWWVIADMNPQVLFPGNIPPGTVIRLPLG